MSGPRPTYLIRRGAIYAVRFRLPSDLAARLGMVELRRSLGTSDPTQARQKCRRAAIWFEQTVRQLRMASSSSRADLEEAARAFFSTEIAKFDAPREFGPDNAEGGLPWNREVTREAMGELEAQLKANSFSKEVEFNARQLSASAGYDFDAMDQAGQLAACRMYAQAQRQVYRLLLHQLNEPWKRYASDDPVFGGQAQPALELSRSADEHATSLRGVISDYLTWKERNKTGSSQMDEIARALGWLREALGDPQDVDRITKASLRDFRDALQQLDVRHRGRPVSFQSRQTTDPSHQIAPVTAARYWQSVRAFFHWAHAEGFISHDPSEGLTTVRPRDARAHQPEPFSREELRQLFRSPLYAGHRSPKFPLAAGECR